MSINDGSYLKNNNICSPDNTSSKKGYVIIVYKGGYCAAKVRTNIQIGFMSNTMFTSTVCSAGNYVRYVAFVLIGLSVYKIKKKKSDEQSEM